MAEIYVTAEGTVHAPADRVYALISDFKQHHHRFLPPSFTNYHVEQGGVGAGTVITFTATGGGRTRGFRMRVEEPDPGRVMVEADTMSSLVTTWTVMPEGDASRVRIETRWNGAAGVPGFFERLFAPRAMRRIYREELKRLDRYARSQRQAPELVGSGH